MAEAIAGFAAVSSILQVIDFAAKVTSHTIHLVRSSKEALEIREMNETDRLAGEYQSIGNVVLDRSSQENQAIPGVQRIYDLAERCKEQSTALLGLLQELRVDPKYFGTKRVLKSLQQAIKTQRKRKRIEQDCKHLEFINSQLSMEFLLLLRLGQYEQNDVSHRLMRAIEEKHQSSVSTVLAARDDIRQAIDELARDQSQPSADNRTVRYRQKLKSDFLGSLLYRGIYTRRDAISPAYHETFDWVLKDDSLGLRQWLLNGSGIFWICGKAGSGKSTLMRYLSQNASTKSLLTQWVESSNSSLVMAEFYFWYAGNKIQRSVEGLLRDLLYQILSHCDDAERITFPDQWQLARNYNETGKNWSRFELFSGIRRLAAACEREELKRGNLACRFCFFIDGLDEFEGKNYDPGSLISILRELTRGSQIKICTSSRPWNAFRSAFEESCPSLKLEDLTRSDISKYVHGCLLSTAADLAASDQETLPHSISQSMSATIGDLAQLIVDKAEGVFLWVELVVKSVQEGLWEGDQVDFLYQRVEAFPEDLDEFFLQILDRVNNVYSQSTAMVLQLAFSYVKENDFAWSESDFTEFWLIKDNFQLIMADPQFGRSIKVRPCSNQELQVMEAETRAFLNACCKDLVHVPRSVNPSSGQVASIKRVEFLHRTVFDFLSSNKMQDRLKKDLPKGFGNLDTFRQMALARSKFICVDEPLVSQMRFNAAARLQCHSPWGSYKDAGARDIDESMILQYYDLGKTYRDTLSATPDFAGFRIVFQQVREVFAAFQCTAMITGDKRLSNAEHKSDIAVLLTAALGLHHLRPFPVEQGDPELVRFLLGIGATPCIHVWKKFLDHWMGFESRQSHAERVKEANDGSQYLRQIAFTMVDQGVVACLSVEEQQDQRPKEEGERDSANVESLRIQFLERILSGHLNRTELEAFIATVSDLHAADTYTCGSVELY